MTKTEFKLIVGGCSPDSQGRPRFIFKDNDDRDIEKKISDVLADGWEPVSFTFPASYIQDEHGHAIGSVFLMFRKVTPLGGTVDEP